MKKIIAMLMALVMVLAVACTAAPAAQQSSDKPAETQTQPAQQTEQQTEQQGEAPVDNMYEIAMVTDVGALMDKSFNQGTWEGCELYALLSGKTVKYYQPANGSEATDDDRYDAMKAAVEGGAKVIVTPGFLQGTALEKAAKEFPDVKFIFIDGWPMGLANVSGISYKEEQSGYLAGYAAVMEGYTKLGFCGGGGGTNPACCRYGYGFVQGAEAAAAVKGVDVEIKYTWQYGSNFSASPELQTMVNGWYEQGTEIVFSAGGSIFNSITAAAAANDAKVIGVDGVIAIPHLGASTPESEENCAAMGAMELIDFLENGNIKNSVNMPAVSVEKSGTVRITVIHKNQPNMISTITDTISKDGDLNIVTAKGNS